MTMRPIWPATGSATGILNVVGPSIVNVHNCPSPILIGCACSVNFALGAIGAFDGSCATSAARYASAIPCRHALSQAAPVWPRCALTTATGAHTRITSTDVFTNRIVMAVIIVDLIRAVRVSAAPFCAAGQSHSDTHQLRLRSKSPKRRTVVLNPVPANPNVDATISLNDAGRKPAFVFVD